VQRRGLHCLRSSRLRTGRQRRVCRARHSPNRPGLFLGPRPQTPGHLTLYTNGMIMEETPPDRSQGGFSAPRIYPPKTVSMPDRDFAGRLFRRCSHAVTQRRGAEGERQAASGSCLVVPCVIASLRDTFLQLNRLLTLRGSFHNPSLLHQGMAKNRSDDSQGSASPRIHFGKAVPTPGLESGGTTEVEAAD
jgi:hypothetical protein